MCITAAVYYKYEYFRDYLELGYAIRKRSRRTTETVRTFSISKHCSFLYAFSCHSGGGIPVVADIPYAVSRSRHTLLNSAVSGHSYLWVLIRQPQARAWDVRQCRHCCTISCTHSVSLPFSTLEILSQRNSKRYSLHAR